MIAALAADELERAGVAAFHPAVHDAGRLAPEVRCPAVAGLASQRERQAGLGVKAQPRVTGHGRSARCGDGTRTAGQLVTGYWLLVTGYWLLVTGYWLLVTGQASPLASSAVILTGHFTSWCRRASGARWS